MELAEERQRLRPLDTWNFSKHRKKALKLRRRHSSCPIRLGKRSGPLVFHIQEGARGAHRRNDLDRRI
jgi:hypothetical protein